MTNIYTARWFELFLRPISPEQTAREVALLQEWLPLPEYERLVDVCCGPGRHAHRLAAAGYAVTGIDRDAAALAEARGRALPREEYVQHDMRHLAELNLRADAVLCLWQSFGYFDPATNRAVLGDMAAMLPAGGRCVLDLCHPGFFAARQGVRSFDHAGASITEAKTVAGGRLRVTLGEGETVIDRFDWQLFEPAECVALAESAGLSSVAACANYDPGQAPSADSPRVQYCFEKRPGGR
ncbi:MAG TPA: class I SAM-dependent methyltransferase [Herpetosiphonaceae bacterium]|nr:class I SAM-dependent methyltransferase [Herpetosiphonaceae bacterium]